MLRGYARVSTDGQQLDAQLEALKAAGCEKIYAEKVSGASCRDRKALAKLLRESNPGDTIVVTRLDRLARSTRDLLNTLDQLSRNAIGFKSLRETSIDTTSPQGRLVISILASISEFERELIQSRMVEGRKRAAAAGVKFGPKFKLNHFRRKEAFARLEAGETQEAIARTYNVDRSSISRLQRVRTRLRVRIQAHSAAPETKPGPTGAPGLTPAAVAVAVEAFFWPALCPGASGLENLCSRAGRSGRGFRWAWFRYPFGIPVTAAFRVVTGHQVGSRQGIPRCSASISFARRRYSGTIRYPCPITVTIT
jgi:DNA invertase Pin-like site-specific DNA recombinase